MLKFQLMTQSLKLRPVSNFLLSSFEIEWNYIAFVVN